MNADLERTPMNIQYRSCGELTYNEMIQKLVGEGKVSMRGLKKDECIQECCVRELAEETCEYSKKSAIFQ